MQVILDNRQAAIDISLTQSQIGLRTSCRASAGSNSRTVTDGALRLPCAVWQTKDQRALPDQPSLGSVQNGRPHGHTLFAFFSMAWADKHFCPLQA